MPISLPRVSDSHPCRHLKIPPARLRSVEPGAGSSRLTRAPCNLANACAFPFFRNQRIFVVGSGNNDVGNATPTRNSDRPAAQEAELRIDSPNTLERQGR